MKILTIRICISVTQCTHKIVPDTKDLGKSGEGRVVHCVGGVGCVLYCRVFNTICVLRWFCVVEYVQYTRLVVGWRVCYGCCVNVYSIGCVLWAVFICVLC